jgi:hypothetical protein
MCEGDVSRVRFAEVDFLKGDDDKRLFAKDGTVMGVSGFSLSLRPAVVVILRGDVDDSPIIELLKAIRCIDDLMLNL